MNTVIMTSCLDLYEKTEAGERIPHAFTNDNGIVDMIKSRLKKQDNFLFVASVQDYPEATDVYANVTFESFDLTIPFKKYTILDSRTQADAAELVREADFIFLCGGHLPTQNKFFNNINLKGLLQNTSALILGGSAGSMNCAETVYCPPEIDGEAADKNFQRYLPGLGYTKTNIIPHFSKYLDLVIDDQRYYEDILLVDSHKTKMLAIEDGSYVVIENGKETVYGKAYTIQNGDLTTICEDNQSLVLQEQVKDQVK